MPHLALRSILFVLTVFVAVTTLFGAVAVVPELPPEWIEGGVFTDYTFPAIALGAVGVLAIGSAVLLAFRQDIAGAATAVVGAAMVIFELVEIAVVGLAIVEHGADQPVAWLQIVYIGIGTAQVLGGLALWRATAADRERRLRTGHHLIGLHS